jgi:DNA repair exonuclease SbcCD ATPase subunit
MIKKLVVKNFRKLVDRTFDFGGGLQVVRGANENGKSTVLEAIGYALFGVKACRTPLSDVVTWGQPEKSLSVELTLEIDGVDYVITRKKSGAEINYGGDGRVVGQKEVGAFIERLLGTNVSNVDKLMLASQGAIRGALDEGPAKTMELIENLSDFGQLDRVIELIQERLVTGPTHVAEDRLRRAQEAYTNALNTPLVDLKVEELAITDRKLEAEERAAEAARIKPAVDAKLAEVSDETAKAKLRDNLAEREARARTQIEQQKAAVAKAAEAAAGDVAPLQAAIGKLERLIADSGEATALCKAHGEIAILVRDYPEIDWEGNEQSFQAELQSANQKVADAQSALAVLDAELRASKPMDGEGACKSCGQTLPNAAAVAKHNADLAVKVTALMAQRGGLEAAVTEAQDYLAALLALQKQAATYYVNATKHATLIDVDWGFVPPKLSWRGEVPRVVALGDAHVQLKAYKAALAEVAAAAVRAETLGVQLKADEHALADLMQEQAELGVSRLAQLRTELDEVSAGYNFHVNRVNELNLQVTHLTAQFEQAQAANMRREQAVIEAGDAKAAAERELEQLNFNNELLKRVRLARPIIADKLWSIVLSAVSSYFTSMRGIPSVVSREDKSFKVDGQEVGGLSGSAKDLLGLSIRLALTRTFIPNTPFLILDEPAAACDENRENVMMGFLVAADFPQTLLVTHSDVESVARNLISV